LHFNKKINSMKLLAPTDLLGLTLKNSMAMAAMTRSRANSLGAPSESTVAYYTQRASAGLIISEAINISPDAIGSPFTPGLFTRHQVAAWKKVTKSVHQHQGVIIAQLWHTGRVGHSVDRNGQLPVAPSALKIEGMQHFTTLGARDFEVPRALSTGEIYQVIADYGKAASAAMEAGFDGVELHAANGYLPNQFLAESANQRTDEFGGSVENRCRFIVAVMRELISEVGGNKVGIKISPFQPYAGIRMDNPIETYLYLINELNQLPIAFVELMRRSPMFPLLSHYTEMDELELFGKDILHPLIANGNYQREAAEALIAGKSAAMVSFGALFLANPDLPRRFELNTELNKPDHTTMFGGGDKGYIDYPSL
jgi:N-ethylmaleimide reductase